MSKIVIGIPCYQDVSAETLVDYMRFAYYVGRRCPEHEFFLDIKSKSEQFRARNAIVEASIQVDADYLFFLDDDHIIDWDNGSGPTDRYAFVSTLLEHMQAEPKRGIVGALYYHRGGDCLPVLMKEGKDGGYYYMRDDQVTGGLQEVAVQGGGCMLIDMNLFSQIPSPWFEPETRIGTDLQICQKAREAGWTVWCDTSIVLGHVMSKREVITPKNRHRIISESGTVGNNKEGMEKAYMASSGVNLYRMDAEEYLQKNYTDILELANSYHEMNFHRFEGYKDKRDYYASLGDEQLARQVWFHTTPEMTEQFQIVTDMIDTSRESYGLDFGCGSAPIGCELALRGHRLDFVDIDGSRAYEFLKWRVKKRGIGNRAGWSLKGPYDYALFMDSIEHIENWEEMLNEVIGLLRPEGVIMTNYFLNNDYDNPEHVSMDQKAVQEFFVANGIFPLNQIAWIKRDLGFMDKHDKDKPESKTRK